MNARLAAVTLLVCASLSHANTVSYFSFNNTLAIATNYTSVNADSGYTGKATVSSGFFVASSSGTTLSAVGGAPAGYSLFMKLTQSGSMLTFDFDNVSGFSNLVFGYDTYRSPGGYLTQTLAYKTDLSPGGAYAPLGLPYTVQPTDFQHTSFSLNGLANVANAKSLSIQMTFTGASMSGDGNRLDNVRLAGDPVAVNAPAAVPLPPAFLGGAALLGVPALKRRRQ